MSLHVHAGPIAPMQQPLLTHGAAASVQQPNGPPTAPATLQERVWRLLNFSGRERGWAGARAVELLVLCMILANVAMVLWASSRTTPIAGYHAFVIFSLVVF